MDETKPEDTAVALSSCTNEWLLSRALLYLQEYASRGDTNAQRVARPIDVIDSDLKRIQRMKEWVEVMAKRAETGDLESRDAAPL